MPEQPDLAGLQAALSGSPLAQGLQMLGDRWTLAVLMGAFTGVRRFNDWQSRLAIPRSTLANRLQRLTLLGLLRQRPGSDRPGRRAYHLTQAGLALYDPVLMSWLWEKRWSPRAQELPTRLQHRCGEGFTPRLVCSHCTTPVGLADLGYTLRPPTHEA
ncbi:MAG: helix-turn-helix transcriptional regulator, partial [Rhodoferax sp.]|nr:helix-turn-helix transcriptional regulator [Rhodoferax sp.]